MGNYFEPATDYLAKLMCDTGAKIRDCGYRMNVEMEAGMIFGRRGFGTTQ